VKSGGLARRLSGRALVGARQPIGQISGRFVGRPPVKRHQRSRDAGNPNDAGAPPVFGNQRRLNEIGLSSNGLFEAMYDVCHVCRRERCFELG
jgi:hypothetical protein